MLLTAIWILEASIGLLGAVLVLADGRRILAAMRRQEPDSARNFVLQLMRDGLVLGGQVVNVFIGLSSGVLAGRAQDGLRTTLGALTLAGLMLAPAILGGISLITYRSRHR